MANFKDITGRKIGKLTAIKPVGLSKDKRMVWLFQCDCGNTIEREGRRKFKSCGCIRGKHNFKDITGQQFNYLTAVKLVRMKNQQAIWLFACSCGNKKEMVASNVKNGTTKSCGCATKELQSEARIKDISGFRYGGITVVRISKTGKNTFYECLCDCGNTFYATRSNILRGAYSSCGCRMGYKGENHWNWKGGRYLDCAGYVMAYSPNHPFGKKKYSKHGKMTQTYVFEHRLVMEKKLGRYLLPNENVHHKNGVKDDNRIENLELWVSPQPFGQKPEDLVAFAKEILKTYADLFPE